MHTKQIKHIAAIIGKMLGIAGLLFVFYKLSQEYTLQSFTAQFSLLLPQLPLLFLINLASTLLGIYAWHLMLQNYATHPFAYKTSYYYFAKTEIAKYLPGNLFHFVGRQALASSIGITQKEMAKISILFSFLLLAATVFSSSFCTFFSDNIPLYILVFMGVSCIIIAAIVYYTYSSFPIREKIKMNLILALSITLQGIMLGIIISVQTDNISMGLFCKVVGIYIISWLIGFITPGASGGLGVREGAFIAIATLLHLHIDSQTIIFSVLLVRVINIITDVIIYLSTFVIKNGIKGLNP